MKSLVIGLALALALVRPLAAQPFLSDAPGPIPTGSGLVGMAFRDVENAIFGRSDNTTIFRTRGVANAIGRQAAILCGQMGEDSLPHPRGLPAAMRVSAAAQDTARQLLCAPDPDCFAAPWIVAELRGGAAGMDGDAASRLVRALRGLFVEPMVTQDERGRRIVGTRWLAAMRAYDEYLEEAPEAVLADPPGVLTAIGIALARMVDVGVEASGR
ncbi:hypothetical protein [Longimicrobium terrae]|uniref:Uncharacterized protein n=1 Tax=Longimicrobium terrae TaxID=1639882 RepID=A0A841GW70_9BACT|nr:hypothetical protein [Longimicrobium terrae]MBB4634704.1 hypothetical protein [Longimicrobium terrae]MBB6068406.1 hypothetical protein [Longimicrobium terrae]NNC32686.1 hypothetical protein [Longimicrobium terrae]